MTSTLRNYDVESGEHVIIITVTKLNTMTHEMNAVNFEKRELNKLQRVGYGGDYTDTEAIFYITNN